ncbi:right-handed parallel beta-helix repeat-containing protein [bacterium]|nr:right-handed parallel beta-helix repeat-containing protein [bacterium]
MKTGSTILLFLSMLATWALSADWYVEQDGTGDFLTIQDAVDAAVSGDVIWIGPGIYEDVQVIDYSYQSVRTCVFVSGKTLRLIGSGADATIIRVGLSPGYDVRDIGVFVHNADHFLRIDDMAFTVGDYGVFVQAGDLKLKNCSLSECDQGLYSRGNQIELVDCSFSDCADYTLIGQCAYARVSRCEYTGNGYLYFSFCDRVDLLDCAFDSRIGATILRVPEYTVEDCTIQSTYRGVGIYSSDGVIRNNQFYGSDTEAIRVERGQASVEDNIIHTGDGCAVSIGRDADVTAHGNEMRAEGDCVRLGGLHQSEDLFYDFRWNDWGTTDPDEIEGMIHDGVDDPEIRGFVIYIPFLGDYVSNEDLDWGAVKRLYHTSP